MKLNQAPIKIKGEGILSVKSSDIVKTTEAQRQIKWLGRMHQRIIKD
jgi:hypothetical protein